MSRDGLNNGKNANKYSCLQLSPNSGIALAIFIAPATTPLLSKPFQ